MQPHSKHRSSNPNDWLAPPELQSSVVRLEPMEAEHREGLIESVKDGELWKLWFTSVPHPSDIDDFIDSCDKYLYEAKQSGRNCICHIDYADLRAVTEVGVDERAMLFNKD